jgi:hypothetical protein
MLSPVPTGKDVAVAFLRHVASGRVREAYDEHIGKDFCQHTRSSKAMPRR